MYRNHMKTSAELIGSLSAVTGEQICTLWMFGYRLKNVKAFRALHVAGPFLRSVYTFVFLLLWCFHHWLDFHPSGAADGFISDWLIEAVSLCSLRVLFKWILSFFKGCSIISTHTGNNTEITKGWNKKVLILESFILIMQTSYYNWLKRYEL